MQCHGGRLYASSLQEQALGSGGLLVLGNGRRGLSVTGSVSSTREDSWSRRGSRKRCLRCIPQADPKVLSQTQFLLDYTGERALTGCCRINGLEHRTGNSTPGF